MKQRGISASIGKHRCDFGRIRIVEQHSVEQRIEDIAGGSRRYQCAAHYVAGLDVASVANYKFGIINLISSWIWAFIVVALTEYFGEEIFGIIDWFADHPLVLVSIAVAVLLGVWWVFHTQTKKKERR